MRLHCTSAVTPAVGPTATSLPRLNSSPSENISRMTPSSESVWTIAESATSGIGTCGPDDQAGEDVAEHDRLAEPLEQDRRDGGDAEHDRERDEEVMGPCMPLS